MNILNAIRRRIRRIFANLLYTQKRLIDGMLIGGGWWGMIRILFVFIVICLFIVLGWKAQQQLDGQPIDFLRWGSLRYLLLPVFAFIAAMLLGAHYVRDVYELPLRDALRYLVSALFTIGQSRMVISDGKAEVPEGEQHIMFLIGGPGLIVVRSGSAVVLEKLKAPSRILGAGAHRISRFERIREIISLADQHGEIASKVVTTKDGIEVRVRDVQYRYRVRTGRLPGDYKARTLSDPFPFSVKAVRDLAYERSIYPDRITPWSHMVRLNVDTAIMDYIAAHTFDDIMAPRQDGLQPREVIARELRSKGIRERMRRVGGELLWVDIGHFEPVWDDVDDQRVDYWQALWAGKAAVTRAYGDAQHLAYHELGRAEAQAQLLVSIARAINEVKLEEDEQLDPGMDEATREQRRLERKRQKIRSIFLVRTAQILDAMSEKPERRPLAADNE